MKKYIHYCWFGNKPLPKLAYQCIESWKKYLPDYEIKCWNEENSDLDECAFVREAYDNKKWAFVADYIRTKAIYEYGGIYFDTDMEITKPIDNIIKENQGFLGVEDSHMIACGVWYEPKPKSYLSKKLLDYYRGQSFFDIDNLYKISIPRLISLILNDYDSSNPEIQHLKHNITIYPRDYFYPLSYDHQYNVFTENTCMIHYYDATWTPDWERRENKIYRLLGRNKGDLFIKGVRTIKKIIKKCGKVILYPVISYKRYKDKITTEYLNSIEKTLNNIDEIGKINPSYIVFVNTNWLGVTNATKELFDNIVSCAELFRKKDMKKITRKIKKYKIKEVVFSGFCKGWKELAICLHNNGIIVKTYYHGSHSQVLEPYGWERNMEIYKLHKDGYIDEMATCKASLVNFYKSYGCNIRLLRNRVVLPKSIKILKNNNNKNQIRIGIYAAKTSDFRKNVFCQMAAASLLGENIVIDMVPLNKIAKQFATQLGVDLVGVEHTVSREELLQHMADCDIVLYVTFSECAPMLPLESFAVGTPCLTGNNHHYFNDTELEKYLVVNDEQNVEEIANKIKLCLANKEKVLKLYAEFEKENTKLSKSGVENYIKIEEEQYED